MERIFVKNKGKCNQALKNYGDLAIAASLSKEGPQVQAWQVKEWFANRSWREKAAGKVSRRVTNNTASGARL